MAKKPAKFDAPSNLKQVLKTTSILVEAGCSPAKGEKQTRHKIWVKWTTSPGGKSQYGWTNYTMIWCSHPNMPNLQLWLKTLRRTPKDKNYQKIDAFEFSTTTSKTNVTERFLRSDYTDKATGEQMTMISYKSSIKFPNDPLGKPYVVRCSAPLPRDKASDMAKAILQIIDKCCKA